MHSVENGFYWLCKVAGIPQRYAPEQSPEICTKYLQDHLRVGFAEALFISALVKEKYEQGKKKIAISDPVSPKCKEEQEKQGLFDAKNHFKKIVDSMKERWQNEATQAIKLLESL
jgi:hypothetical protein